MKKIKRIAVTTEGFKKLKNELNKLRNERPQAVKNLAEARDMGDLSENGLYAAAKSRLRSIDNQIFRLEIQIKLADIKQPSSSNVIDIGSKVKLVQKNQETIFEIVGDYEADPINKKISQYSPLGRVLMGKKIGERVEFVAPKGKVVFIIKEIL